MYSCTGRGVVNLSWWCSQLSACKHGPSTEDPQLYPPPRTWTGGTVSGWIQGCHERGFPQEGGGHTCCEHCQGTGGSVWPKIRRMWAHVNLNAHWLGYTSKSTHAGMNLKLYVQLLYKVTIVANSYGTLAAMIIVFLLELLNVALCVRLTCYNNYT